MVAPSGRGEIHAASGVGATGGAVVFGEQMQELSMPCGVRRGKLGVEANLDERSKTATGWQHRPTLSHGLREEEEIGCLGRMFVDGEG